MQLGDRLEGRPKQAVQISDLTREIREKSDTELHFYLDNSASRRTRRRRCSQFSQ
jgi:hypothetical protein